MGKNSFAEILGSVNVMVSGLKANAEAVGKRGIDQKFVDQLEQLQQTILKLDNEQEALKSRLKEKTASIEEKTAKLKTLLSEAKKVVKLAIPQEGWKEFGMDDKR